MNVFMGYQINFNNYNMQGMHEIAGPILLVLETELKGFAEDAKDDSLSSLLEVRRRSSHSVISYHIISYHSIVTF